MPPADRAPGEPKRRGRPPKNPAQHDAKKAQRTSPVPPPAAKPAGRPTKGRAELLQSAESMLAWVTAGLALVAPADAAVIEVRAERIAGRLAECAEHNAALAKLLTAAGTGGGWAGLAAELGTVGVAIAANHHAVPVGAAMALMPEYRTVLAEVEAREAQARQAAAQRQQARMRAASI